MNMNNPDRAKKRLIEISIKNQDKKEYSLGDVLLLNRFEEELKECGWTKEAIKALSPSFYL